MSAKKKRPAPTPCGTTKKPNRVHRRALQGKSRDAGETANRYLNARLERATRASNDANRALNFLLRLAGRSEERVAAGFAASILVNILTSAVGSFEILAGATERRRANAKFNTVGMDPEFPPVDFACFARDMDRWPVLYYAHADKRDEVEKMIVALKLGSAMGVNFSGKRFSLTTLVNDVVLTLREFIERHRSSSNGRVEIHTLAGRSLTPEEREVAREIIRKKVKGLPPLSAEKDVLSVWQKAGRALVPVFYGKEFHKHTKLASLVPKDDKPGSKKRHTSATLRGALSAGDIKEAIQRRLKGGWKKVTGAG